MRRLLCENCGEIKDISEFSERMAQLAIDYEADFGVACKECEEKERKRLQKVSEEV